MCLESTRLHEIKSNFKQKSGRYIYIYCHCPESCYGTQGWIPVTGGFRARKKCERVSNICVLK